MYTIRYIDMCSFLRGGSDTSGNLGSYAYSLGIRPGSVRLRCRRIAFGLWPALLENRVPRPRPRLFPRVHFRDRAPPSSAGTLNCARKVGSCEAARHRRGFSRGSKVVSGSFLDNGFVVLLAAAISTCRRGISLTSRPLAVTTAYTRL